MYLLFVLFCIWPFIFLFSVTLLFRLPLHSNYDFLFLCVNLTAVLLLLLLRFLFVFVFLGAAVSIHCFSITNFVVLQIHQRMALAVHSVYVDNASYIFACYEVNLYYSETVQVKFIQNWSIMLILYCSQTATQTLVRSRSFSLSFVSVPQSLSAQPLTLKTTKKMR